MDNYYKILGVKDFAELDDIKIAYRKLAKKFHPDVNDGDEFFEERFKEIQIAYEIFSDPNRRTSYDENLKRSLQNSNLNSIAPSKEEPKSTPPIQKVRRENPYIFVKGKFVRRKRW